MQHLSNIVYVEIPEVVAFPTDQSILKITKTAKIQRYILGRKINGPLTNGFCKFIISVQI